MTFHTDSWVECQDVQLPLAVFRPGLGNNEVMIVGDEAKSCQFLTKVFIGTFNDMYDYICILRFN